MGCTVAPSSPGRAGVVVELKRIRGAKEAGLERALDEAMAHIAAHSTAHSDGILTATRAHAERFVAEVDSAVVYVNASTRFSDGAQLGLGAEVAVSTQRLHARGPMGLEGLTTYKFKLYGDGHTVAEYASGAKKFTHRPIS